MTDEELDELRQRYNAGMRAMSPEAMKARELAQSAGMRNAYPNEQYMRGMAQTVNLWPQTKFEEPPPKPPTRWQRFRQWLHNYGGTDE